MAKPKKGTPPRQVDTITAEQFQQLIAECDAEAKRSKYGNKPIVIDDIWFQSTAEGNYYQQLKVRMKAGEVSGYLHQVPFPVVIDGLPVCDYIADFVVYYPDGREEIIDVKGVETDVFKLKRKLLKATSGLDIILIKKPSRKTTTNGKQKRSKTQK